MEGVFSFFLESSFLGLFLFGEKRLSPIAHWFSAVAVFLGSWLSGFFIIVTDAWMQHPTGYSLGPKGEILLSDLGAFLLNPWGLWQYLHNMIASVVTGSFVMASIGAFYLLTGKHTAQATTFVRTGVIAGTVAVALLVFPTGDQQGKMVLENQPVTLAAMEGLFDTEEGAPLAILGQPDMEKMKLDNPFVIPEALSFLTYKRWGAKVQGLRDFPRDSWPDNVPLLYFSYHIMVGLGTFMLALMAISLLLLRGGRLFTARPVLWALMLAMPFPYIATTAGWMTAEIGRQPWLMYGLMRTSQGSSPQVSAGNGLFTLLGFMGLYLVLGILFLYLVMREIEHGPEEA
jgi:cytochrome d ubiquinol oxidase subunit I